MRIQFSFAHIGRLFLLFLLTCILFFPGSAAYAEETGNLQGHKTSIDKVRQSIQIHLIKIHKTGTQEVNLLEQLGEIDRDLSTQKKKLSDLQQQLEAQEVVLTGKEEDLFLAQKNKEIASRQLENRLRAYYLMGRVGFLNVIFSDKNLPELILFHDSYKKLLEYDKSLIDNYRETISLFEGASSARETEKNLLESFIKQNKEEQNRLGIIRKEQQQLLLRIQSQKGLYEQAVREMKRAEADLTRSLVSLKKESKSRQQGFLSSKGRLPGPVQGRIVIRFGEVVEGRTSNGITIATKEGAEVFSIFAGRVIFAGYKIGFGNMVIIDHGLQHYTITARLDIILVEEGQQVSSNQKTGTTGEIATLFSQGLYFEIRHGSKPLDPLEWLRSGIYERN